ncbi:flavin reductase family protein [Pseudomonas sp.]|uniref:flavin reductase family protein n=1 Tax=Pseudomonas sp. TaxID=306 RepID=UPI00211DEBB8
MSMKNSSVDTRHFRRMMGKFATGVTVITFEQNEKVVGMTANAFMSLSMDPPMVLISVRNESRFANQIKEGDRFGISFLREEHEHYSRHFGGRPDPDLVPATAILQGTPVLKDGLVQIVASAHAIYPGGDHLIYTANVDLLQESSNGRPLLFFSGGYKQLHALDPMQCWNDVED